MHDELIRANFPKKFTIGNRIPCRNESWARGEPLVADAWRPREQPRLLMRASAEPAGRTSPPLVVHFSHSQCRER
jgi:hypothetical protein